eukprot:m.273647 g.273647  ORF g.273647 m.273647 type:complete len:485 (-) comp16282_c0_seq8:582-2036(-)
MFRFVKMFAITLHFVLFAQGVPMQGFLGTYHAFNGSDPTNPSTPLWNDFGFGTVAIENSDRDGGYDLQNDLDFQCHKADVNSIFGMLLPPTEGGVVNNPNDTSLYKPVSPPGLIQGAARWSKLSKSCPQISGVIIDDFLGNYVGKVNNSDCVKCPPSQPYMYGSRTAGFYCCSEKATGHCDGPKPPCCLVPGSVEGCQVEARCGTNPTNKPACQEGGISFYDLQNIKAALQGKEVDPYTGTVNHSSPVTTGNLRLFVVWYTVQTAGMEGNELITAPWGNDGYLLDGASLWMEGPAQDTQAGLYTSQIEQFREVTKMRSPDTLPIFTGSYLIHSRVGWLKPAPFWDMVNQSLGLYGNRSIGMEGFYIFAGDAIPQMNTSTWETFDLVGNLEKMYWPHVGMGEGTCVDATGKPVANAIVEVTYTDSQVSVTRKVSDENGRFSFGGWVAGFHKIDVKSSDGGMSGTMSVQFSAGTTKQFSIKLQSSV